MFTVRIARCAVIGMLLVSNPANARSEGESVLRRHFDTKDAPIALWSKDGKHALEVCGGDWCQLVIAPNKPAPRDGMWDAAFLMAYFFDFSDDLRDKYKRTATAVMKAYKKECDATLGEVAAECVLKAIQDKQGLRYFRVNYDIGHRCVSEFTAAAPHFTDKGECKPINPKRFPRTMKK